MKILTFVISLIISFFTFSSTSAQDCNIGTAKDSIVTDHFKFVAYTTGNVKYENAYKHAFYSIGDWEGGKDDEEQIHIAGVNYADNNQSDYYPGPLYKEFDTTTQELCNLWDRIFKITEEDILEYLSLYNDGLLMESNIPDAIKYWPSRGNPYMEEYFSLGMNISAPFVDGDSDGLYSPLNGDYPMLKNASEMMYWVYNDVGGIHNYTLGEPVYKIAENYAFVYGNNEDEEIRKTIFHTQNISHSALIEYDHLYKGVFADFDSKNFSSDKFGTIVDQDAVYFFNDCWKYGNCQDSTFKDSIITLFKYLVTPKDEFETESGLISTTYRHPYIDQYENYTISNEFAYYNMLNGFFQNGFLMTYDNDGFNIGSADSVFYLNDDIHLENSGWDECNYEGKIDVRVMLTTGGERVLPGAVHRTTYSISSFDGLPSPCESIDDLIEESNKIQEVYNSNQQCILATNDINLENELQVFPNPNNGKFTIHADRPFSSISIFDVLGHKIFSIENDQNASIDIDLSNQKSGQYFAKIQYKNGASSYTKFEKMQ